MNFKSVKYQAMQFAHISSQINGAQEHNIHIPYSYHVIIEGDNGEEINVITNSVLYAQVQNNKIIELSSCEEEGNGGEYAYAIPALRSSGCGGDGHQWEAIYDCMNESPKFNKAYEKFKKQVIKDFEQYNNEEE